MEDFVMDSNDKIYGILAYIPFLWLVTLLAGKSEFSRYHANQGVVLFILEVILGAIATLIGLILGIIPVVGGWITSIIGGIFGLIALVFIIVGIINAANCETKPLPIIGSIKILK